MCIAVFLGSGCTSDRPVAPLQWEDFGEPTVYASGGTGLTGLVAVDLLGDGHVDLAMVARGDATVRVLTGSKTGVFKPVQLLSAGFDARDATAADVNGDGIPDLLVIGHFDNGFHVRLGQGDGAYASQVKYELRNHGHYVITADLNGDAFDDVVAVHDGSGQPIRVSTYLGTQSGALQFAGEIATTYLTGKGLVAGDFDGDGKTDVGVATADNRASVLVFAGLGNGQLQSEVVLASISANPLVSDGTTSIAAADLNGDGLDDLVVAHQDFINTLAIRLSTGAGFAAPQLTPLPSPIDVAIGDVNGDGRLDVIAANLEHASISLLLGTAAGFESPRTIPAGPNPASLAVADLDGDGFADVAVADITDHKVRVLLRRQ